MGSATRQKIDSVTSSLRTCIKHFRINQLLPPLEETTLEYREGYRKAMRHAESVLGVLMWEQGIDIR